MSRTLNSEETRMKASGQIRFVWFAVGLAILVGCGPENRASVRGNVTLDGKSLEVGVINFFPFGDNRGPTAGGTIENGRYQVEATKGVVLGKNRVTISSKQKTGRQIHGRDGDVNEERAEAVPAQYNTNSTLVCEVQADGNELNFELHGRVPIETSRRRYSNR